MCNVCCKESRGWCKSFTRTEILLAMLEGVLLLMFIAFLVFLILHYLACAAKPFKVYAPGTTVGSANVINTETDSITSTKTFSTEPTEKKPIASGICTWNMSNKTPALTRYFERTTRLTTKMRVENYSPPELGYPEQNSYYDTDYEPDRLENMDNIGFLDDWEDAEEEEKRSVLALVKFNPLGDVTFGCIATTVSENWALTAASCIDAIEEAEELASYVLAEGLGRAAGRVMRVRGVRRHPSYGGPGRGPDLAALRSRAALRAAAALPAPLHWLLLPVGERLTLLGYGPTRSVESDPLGRLRRARVHRLPARRCAADGARRRQLAGGAALGLGPGGAGLLCAGGLAACAGGDGAPLLRRRRLLGVRAGGAACGPAAFVNVASLRDWLDALIQ